MFTRVYGYDGNYDLYKGNPFIWTLLGCKEPNQCSSLEQDESQQLVRLVPFESENFYLSGDIRLVRKYQVGISSELFERDFVEKILKQGGCVQVWIDRPISLDEAKRLKELTHQFRSLELVYLMDLFHHPEEIFQHLGPMDSIIVHLKIKESRYDQWPSPIEIWDRILWLKGSKRFDQVSTQILNSQISSCSSDELKYFLLHPTYESLARYLSHLDFKQSLIQKSVSGVARLTSSEVFNILRQTLLYVLFPSRERFGYLIHAFGLLGHKIRILIYYKTINLGYKIRDLGYGIFLSPVFYPFRKAYWIVEHAIKKRLPRQRDS